MAGPPLAKLSLSTIARYGSSSSYISTNFPAGIGSPFNRIRSVT